MRDNPSKIYSYAARPRLEIAGLGRLEVFLHGVQVQRFTAMREVRSAFAGHSRFFPDAALPKEQKKGGPIRSALESLIRVGRVRLASEPGLVPSAQAQEPCREPSWPAGYRTAP